MQNLASEKLGDARQNGSTREPNPSGSEAKSESRDGKLAWHKGNFRLASTLLKRANTHLLASTFFISCRQETYHTHARSRTLACLPLTADSWGSFVQLSITVKVFLRIGICFCRSLPSQRYSIGSFSDILDGAIKLGCLRKKERKYWHFTYIFEHACVSCNYLGMMGAQYNGRYFRRILPLRRWIVPLVLPAATFRIQNLFWTTSVSSAPSSLAKNGVRNRPDLIFRCARF